MPHDRDPPGSEGRSRPVVPGLGDHGRRARLGGHRPAGGPGDGRRPDLGVPHLPGRPGRAAQEHALQRAGDRRRGRADPRGGGQGDRPGIRARAAGLHAGPTSADGRGPRSAKPTAASPGPIPPSTCCAASAPPTAHPAWPPSCAACRSRSSTPTAGVSTRPRVPPNPAPSSPVATAPSSSAPATARSGSVICAPAPTRARSTSSPRRPSSPTTSPTSPRPRTDAGYREIGYRRDGPVGVLDFRFYNGAMSTGQCRRLLAALRHATAQDTRVLLLRGGQPFSNGIHLGVIDAAAGPGRRGLGQHRRDRRRLRGDHHLRRPAGRVLDGRQRRRRWSHAGAGRRPGRAPRRSGAQPALPDDGPVRLGVLDLRPAPPRRGPYGQPTLTTDCVPVGAAHAARIGLVDRTLPGDPDAFERVVERQAHRLAVADDYPPARRQKRERRAADEQHKPLRSLPPRGTGRDERRHLPRPTRLRLGPQRLHHEASHPPYRRYHAVKRPHPPCVSA